uniref:Uncharacterized protein n=1 Tax=Anguilla anguilla TaxID=7936 RepID=A0A0E9UXV1_ANGAN
MLAVATLTCVAVNQTVYLVRRHTSTFKKTTSQM